MAAAGSSCWPASPGSRPLPLDPVYAANKAAVVNLVRSVGPGLAAQGIVVNAVCPGFTDTAIVDPVRGMLEAMRVPLMAVDEVVAAVATVLGSEASGEAWLVQYGHPAQPYRFRGVPGPAPAARPPDPTRRAAPPPSPASHGRPALDRPSIGPLSSGPLDPSGFPTADVRDPDES